MRWGPQCEPIPETEAELRLSTAELREARHKHKSFLKDIEKFLAVPDDDDEDDLDDVGDSTDRDVSADGSGFGPVVTPDSSVASGTDRDRVATEQAVLIGPQGEKIYPTADGICPVCGQQFPEQCSDGGQGADPEMTMREDDYIDEIDEDESDEAFEDATPQSDFELLA
jgi:hypothetical protein